MVESEAFRLQLAHASPQRQARVEPADDAPAHSCRVGAGAGAGVGARVRVKARVRVWVKARARVGVKAGCRARARTVAVAVAGTVAGAGACLSELPLSTRGKEREQSLESCTNPT